MSPAAGHESPSRQGAGGANGAGPGAKPRPRRKEQARGLAAGVVVALVVVFGVLNTEKVKVDWIVFTSHTALIIVILVSFLLGAICGAAVWRRRQRGSRN